MTPFDAAVPFDAAIPFDGVSIPAGWRSCLQLVFGTGGVCGSVQGVAPGVFYPGDWPTIRVRRQVRAVVAGYQDRTVVVPRQVRTVADPEMGE